MMKFPNAWKVIKNVPNHQPGVFYMRAAFFWGSESPSAIRFSQLSSDRSSMWEENSGSPGKSAQDLLVKIC
jgi:hypothetical protein